MLLVILLSWSIRCRSIIRAFWQRNYEALSENTISGKSLRHAAKCGQQFTAVMCIVHFTHKHANQVYPHVTACNVLVLSRPNPPNTFVLVRRCETKTDPQPTEIVAIYDKRQFAVVAACILTHSESHAAKRLTFFGLLWSDGALPQTPVSKLGGDWTCQAEKLIIAATCHRSRNFYALSLVAI